MQKLSRCATLLILAITAYHGYAAIVLFSLLLRDKTTTWTFFGVANCCDIPRYEVIGSTAFTATTLAIIGFTGRFLVPGLWRFKAWAWVWSIVLCVLLIWVHWAAAGISDHLFKGQHYRFIAVCVVTLVLLWCSKPLYKKPATPEAKAELTAQT